MVVAPARSAGFSVVKIFPITTKLVMEFVFRQVNFALSKNSSVASIARYSGYGGVAYIIPRLAVGLLLAVIRLPTYLN